MKLHKGKTGSIKEFEKWSHSYDHSILNFVLFGPAYRIMLREVGKRAIKTNACLRVLDIGCGTGTFLAKCIAGGLNIEGTGVDMAYNMIMYAKRKAESIGKDGWDLSFAVGDAEHLPFQSGYFDMVTCSNSFHHYPNQFQAIKEMHRVLKDKGTLVIVDGHRDDPWGYFIFDVAVDRFEKHVHHCSRRRFMGFFKEAGFGKVTQRMEGLFPPLLMTAGEA